MAMAPKKRTSLGSKRKADDAGLQDEVETVLEVGEGRAACAPVMAKLDGNPRREHRGGLFGHPLGDPTEAH